MPQVISATPATVRLSGAGLFPGATTLPGATTFPGTSIGTPESAAVISATPETATPIVASGA